MKKMLSFLVMITLASSWISGEEYDFIGRHYVASYHECDYEALRDLETLKEKMIEASTASGATVLSTRDFVFEPDGMTMVLLLSESHASIHTYPEHNACFVDLFTCGTTCDAEKFADVLVKYLSPTRVDERTFHRE